MSTTAKLLITKFEQNQSNGDVTANEFAAAIDAAAQISIISDAIADPSTIGSPAEGDTYMVAASGVGAWSGKDGKITWYASGWKGFVAPYAGMVAWFANYTDGSNQRIYDTIAAAWVSPRARRGIKITSSNYTVGPTVDTVFVGAAATITLPDASNWWGREITVQKTVNTGATITVNSVAGSINGSASVNFVAAYGKGVYHSDGTNWFIKV